MRALVTLFPLVCVMLSACGEAPETPGRGTDAPHGVRVAGLEARLVGEPLDDQGRYALSVPFEARVGLALRITNVSDVAMQVPRSSYPLHYFFKLEIARVEDDETRTPVPLFGELYPFKDMKQPVLEYVTLKPGEFTERNMDVLVREAYGLNAYFGSSKYDELRALGFGMLRDAGTYEVRGHYAPNPTFLDGKPHDSFGDKVGRDDALSIWPGPVIDSQTLTMRVTRD